MLSACGSTVVVATIDVIVVVVANVGVIVVVTLIVDRCLQLLSFLFLLAVFL